MDRGASTSQPTIQPYYDLLVDAWEPAPPDRKNRNPNDEAHIASGDPDGTPVSFDFAHGRWRPAKIRLVTPPGKNPYTTINHLVISYPDHPYPIYTIAIHQLYQSDIRPTHVSVFDLDHVIGIHRRTGKHYDAPPDQSNSKPDATSSLRSNSQSPSSGLQISSPRPITPQHARLAGWDVGSSMAAAEKSKENTSFSPVYIKFNSKDEPSTWVPLLHAHARPESFVDAVPSDPTLNEEVFQHRVWRGLNLTISWLDGLDGNEEGRVKEGSSAKSTKDQSGGGSHVADLAFYCDILLDGLLIGRTTTQRWISSHSTNSPMRVDWNEHFDFPDLPPFGKLQLLLWRVKAHKIDHKDLNKEATSSSSGGGSSSDSKRLASSFTARISHAVGLGHKEPSRKYIGQVQIHLRDFRRGDMVDGKWEATSLASRIPWRMGSVLTMGLKLKVEEYNVMPLEVYTPLSTFLKPASTFHLLDARSFPKPLTKGSDALIKTCLPTLQRCFYQLSVDDKTIVSDAEYLLSSEITSLAEKTLAHPGSTSGNTLFRSGAVTSKLVEMAMKDIGREWLFDSLHPFVEEVVTDRYSMGKKEKSDSRSKGKQLQQFDTGAGSNASGVIEQDVLQRLCERAYQCIWKKREQCPDILREIFSVIRNQVDDKFGRKPHRAASYKSKPLKDYSTSATAEDSPDHDHEQSGGDDSNNDKSELFKYRVLSSFTFLRLFSPALLNPHLYNLSRGRLDDASCVILKDVARMLQQLANLNLSKANSNDPFLRTIFSKDNTGGMMDYLLSISTVNPTAAHLPATPTFASGRDSPRPPQTAPPTIALQARLQLLPHIHRESVLLAPHRIDAARCLATIAAAIARHTRNDDLLDDPNDDWSRLRRICLRIEEQRLRCSRTLEPHTDKSPEGERDEPSWQMADTTKTVSRAWDDHGRAVEADVEPGPSQNRRMGGIFDSPLLDNASPSLNQQSTFTTPTFSSTQTFQKPSPALSQVSTFTSATIGYGSVLNDYYDEGDAPEPPSPPPVASGSGFGAPPPRPPRLGRRPSTAPTSKVSQIPGLSTTSENDSSGNVL